MRAALLVVWLAVGCQPPMSPAYAGADGVPRPDPAGAPAPGGAPRQLGALDDRYVDFAFDGGQLDFEMYRDGDHITQLVRSHYAVALMVSWTLSELDNVEPLGPTHGVTFVPAASAASAIGEPVVIAELRQLDRTQHYSRQLEFKARFGDPSARPTPYPYALPYPHGLTFSVLQGFHGSFSHRGSNEFAVDFDCPVATPVTAARPGLVVVTNAAAQGSGTTPEYLDYKRTNFVMVRHDDGTLGEYMHLSPSSIEVQPGQHVERGQVLGLSGNTGFSSTPHLHFQVMTAAADGIAATSFPFEMAVAPRRVQAPIQGQRYAAWE